jgi:hypothetical protein
MVVLAADDGLAYQGGCVTASQLTDCIMNTSIAEDSMHEWLATLLYLQGGLRMLRDSSPGLCVGLLEAPTRCFLVATQSREAVCLVGNNRRFIVAGS